MNEARARWHGRVLIALAVLVPATTLHAQGLGEAARKAQEQRKTAGPSTRITGITDAFAFQEIPLTVDLVNQYATARLSVSDWLWNHQGVTKRMRAEIGTLARGRDLPQVYERVPEVKSRIEFHGFTAESFLRVHRTIERARARVDKNDVAKGPNLELQEANTRFMAENYVVLRPTFEKLSGSNTWLPATRYDLPY